MSSVLLFDTRGLFTDLAYRLTFDFDRVGYFCPWQIGAYPTGRELLYGYGLRGVNREKYFHQAKQNYDLLVFPDVYDGDLVASLRREGFSVWGSGMMGELELLRWKTHQRIVAAGLPHPKREKVVGVDALESYLGENGDIWVKLSGLRGLDETWLSQNLELSKGKLDDIRARYDAPEITEFICEENLPDASEVGYDGICIDGQFPETAVLGVECKDRCYACQVVPYKELPDEALAVNGGLSDALKSEYRNWLSTEIRDGKLIDVAARAASPGGEVYNELVTNLGEVLTNGAQGKLVEPSIQETFGAQIVLTSEWSEHHRLIVQFPEEIRRFVKLYHHFRVNGKDIVATQNTQELRQIGSVVATGSTMQEAKKLAEERAAQVKAFKLETCAEWLDDAIEEVQETV